MAERFDVMATAIRLAPHSARIRAFLAMLERNRGRIDRDRNPALGLPKLVEEVMARLGVNSDGEFIALSVGDESEPQSIDAALRWMERRQYVNTTTHWEQIYQANRIGVYPPLVRWADKVVEAFGKAFGIPVCAETMMVTKADYDRLFVTGKTEAVYGSCPSHHGFAVDLVHAVRGAALPAKCWDVFTELGLQFAPDFRLELEHWSSRPEHWFVRGWEELALGGDEIDGEERPNPSRSPPGERERLEKYWGVK